MLQCILLFACMTHDNRWRSLGTTKLMVQSATHPVIWSLTAHTMAWPGGMRISRGKRPLHRASIPSSFETLAKQSKKPCIEEGEGGTSLMHFWPRYAFTKLVDYKLQCSVQTLYWCSQHMLRVWGHGTKAKTVNMWGTRTLQVTNIFTLYFSSPVLLWAMSRVLMTSNGPVAMGPKNAALKPLSMDCMNKEKTSCIQNM